MCRRAESKLRVMEIVLAPSGPDSTNTSSGSAGDPQTYERAMKSGLSTSDSAGTGSFASGPDSSAVQSQLRGKVTSCKEMRIGSE